MQILIQLGVTKNGPTKALNVGMADGSQGPLFMISWLYYENWEVYDGRVIFQINGPKWSRILRQHEKGQ